MQISKDLGTIGRYLRRQKHMYMEPLGLKGLHAGFLADICREPGISQDGLAQRIGVDKSNIARQAAILEEKGFLYRSQGQDKRVLCLYPTEKTLALFPGLCSSMEQWEQTLLQDLSGEEIQQLSSLLAKVQARASKEVLCGKIR